MARAYEVNFDGIVGATHNYAGLSYGNLASTQYKLTVSNPREAALQGLEKMKFLMDLGIKQGVLPPQERPHLPTLRRLGFFGSDAQVLDAAYRADPALLATCCSSSSMWAANAATVSPSADTRDGRSHFTPANLITHAHRAIEAEATGRILRAIFKDESCFAHHSPLPLAIHFSDEGAANHTRLCRSLGEPGLEIFTFGRTALAPEPDAPRHFPARQTREASAAVARLHQLDESRVLFVRQSPQAIDAGAFHNDVVAVGHENVMLYHARAYTDASTVMESIRRAFAQICGGELHLIQVEESMVPLDEAVATYLFNSQIVTLPNGTMTMIAPAECRQSPRTIAFIEKMITAGGPIRSVHYVDVRQSMRNGGGPACLRLRVVLTDDQIRRTHPGVFLTPQLYAQLKTWIEKHYRDHLEARDLSDPKLLQESRTALDELTAILGIGPIYPFQRPPGC